MMWWEPLSEIGTLLVGIAAILGSKLTFLKKPSKGGKRLKGQLKGAFNTSLNTVEAR